MSARHTHTVLCVQYVIILVQETCLHLFGENKKSIENIFTYVKLCFIWLCTLRKRIHNKTILQETKEKTRENYTKLTESMDKLKERCEEMDEEAAKLDQIIADLQKKRDEVCFYVVLFYPSSPV